MSKEENAFDVPSLLGSTQFPAMHVDSGAVLAGGRRRVQRRRVQVLALTVAALIVLVPGGWLVSRSIDRAGPVPAGKTHQLTTGLFAKTDGTGNLGNGKVRLYDASAAGIDFATAPRTYQISRSGDGLRVARVSGGHRVDLPETGSGADGLFQAADGQRGIVAVEAPADVSWVGLIGADDGGTDQPVASYLPDGTAVVLIETERPLRHTVDAVIWWRADGSLGANTGERPAVVTQDKETVYYFSRLGVLGIIGKNGEGMVRARGYTIGAGVTGTSIDFTIAGLYPRGVSKVHLSPAIPGATTHVTAMPGTTWDLVTVRYRGTDKAPTPKVVTNYGTWDPSQGNPPATAP